jgi:hypothetical protein
LERNLLIFLGAAAGPALAMVGAMLSHRTLLLATSVATAFGCAPLAAPDPDDIEDGFAVDEGKEDDYFSVTAREYVLEGRSTVTVEEGLTTAAAAARAKELITLKHVAIAWFLNQYLVDKEHEEENADYGGYSAMVKTGSYEDLEIRPVNGRTFEFKFAQVIAGRNDLLRRIPTTGGRLTVEIGKPSNEDMARLETNAEWYRDEPWSAWNPSEVAADKKETLTLAIRLEERSADAWWDFARLISDGKIDIDVHFGWDYHDNYHLKHSRAFYSWLVGRGFKSPVSSFDRLKRTSGPLTKKLKANGKEITVEVRIFYGKPGTETDPDTDAGGRVLEDDVRTSLLKRDVIIYSGHSGPFYGFALANWKKTNEGDLDDADMLTVMMPSDRYQIVLAEGCDTYMIGQAFKLNPNKNGENIDIVTTTSFSDASTPAVVEDFVRRLLETDTTGRHRPRALTSLLEDLDEDSSGTLYGVHGIDDNPRLHPYANVDKMCDACGKNADCGGVGNACIKVGTAKRCAPACTDDSGCPADYKCKAVASSSTATIYGRMCVPADNTCE